jgi:ArsR family transcriptional regulator
LEDHLDERNKALFEARARIIKAIAHSTRLFIIDELSREEKCVAELTRMIGADTSTVSKHLTILKNAGIIGAEKRGSHVYYRLRVPCIIGFFSCVESVLKSTSKEQLALIGR